MREKKLGLKSFSWMMMMNKTEEIKLESTEKVTKVEEVNPLQREKKEKLESLLTDSGGNDFTEKKKGRGRP